MTRAEDVAWLDAEVIRLSAELRDAADQGLFQKMEQLVDRITALKRLKDAG